MEDSIKRWTAKRKTVLVVEILQSKTTVAAVSRAYDLSPSEIEGWVDDARKGMENALRANPLEDVPVNQGFQLHEFVAHVDHFDQSGAEKIIIETCQACGGAMKVIACIEDALVIRQILDHLDRNAPATAPALLPQSRAPPRTARFDTL